MIVTNPPTHEEIKEDGFYIWGTERTIEEMKLKGRVFK
jgi:hypothetical protein